MSERPRHIPLDVANASGAWWGLLAAAGLTGALIAGALMDVLTRSWPEGQPSEGAQEAADLARQDAHYRTHPRIEADS